MAESYIPVDILLNILVRVPALSLYRLKLVSKEWCRIISDSNFAEAQLGHQSQEVFGWGFYLNTTDGVFFIHGTQESTPKLRHTTTFRLPEHVHVPAALGAAYVFFMGGSSETTSNPPQPVKMPGAVGQAFVFYSCKGLVLFRSTGGGYKLHVANLVTGESLILPPFYGYNDSPHNMNSAGLGFKSGRGDVTVVMLVHRTPNTPFMCGILTLGCSQWREIRTPILGHQLQVRFLPVFAGGGLHWRYDTGLLSLDLGREKFQQTEVTFCSPDDFRLHSSCMEWNGYIAVIIEKKPSPFSTVWILEESEWTKQLDIDNAFLKRLGHSNADRHPPHLCASLRNGELLLYLQLRGDSYHMFVYDLGRRKMTEFTQLDRNFLVSLKLHGMSLIPHVDSLVSCSSAPLNRKCRKITILLKLAGFFRRILSCSWRNIFRLHK